MIEEISTASLTKAAQDVFAGMLAYEMRVLVLQAQDFVAEQWPEATLPGVLYQGVQFAKDHDNPVVADTLTLIHDMVVGMNAIVKTKQEDESE